MKDDFYTVLVDCEVSLDDAPQEAARLVAWLQEKGIVGPAEVQKEFSRSSESSYIKGDNVVYRPGPNFRDASEGEYLLGLTNNYLEIITQRTVFHPGSMGEGVYCAKCHADQVEYSHAWKRAIQTWQEGHPEPLTCAKCGHTAHVSGWLFDPVYGFGNLGFSFHNWSLKPDFVEAFEHELGRPVIAVHEVSVT